MAAGSIIVDLQMRTASIETDSKRAQDSIAKLEKELRALQKSMNDTSSTYDNMGRQARRAQDSFNGMSRGVQQSQAGFRNMNQTIQNTSYQITDFVVQVQGGVSAMRAFSQQAPQFLGAFGPTGAMLGVVAALAGAFIPMAVEAIKGASAVKTLDEAQKSLADAMSQVNVTAQTFDMKNMIEQFNAADSNVRRAIINLVEYRRTATQIAAEESNRALQSQLRGLTDPGVLQRAMGNFEGADLGINPSVAKDLFAEIRSGTTEAQILAQKYSAELMKGNKEARALAETLNKVAIDQQSAANAASAQSKFLAQANKAGATGMIPVDKAKQVTQATKESKDSVTSFIDTLVARQEDINRFGEYLNALAEAFNAGRISNEAYQLGLDQLSQKVRSFEGMKQLSTKMSEEMKIAQQITQNFAQQFSDTLVNGLMKGQLAFQDFANSIISMVMKIMINRAVLMFLNAFLPGAGDTGPTITPMGDSFADGGYTGDGGKYQPAGVVHAGEFVMTKEATSRIGVGNLYRMMRGYADGGLVGSSPVAGGSGGGNININVTNEAGGDGYQATAKARKNDSGFDIDILVRKALTNDLRSNGPMTQTIGATFGLRRSA